MTDWKRFQDMLERKLDEHHIHGHVRHYLLPIVWAAKALADEDAEREGQQVACDGDLKCDTHTQPKMLVDREWLRRKIASDPDDAEIEAGVMHPEASAAGSLPPLDPALVEECISAYYDVNGIGPDWTHQHAMRAALTHYRERVEKPLREALDTYQKLAKNSTNSLFDERDKRGKVEAEADRLRGELAEMEKRKDGAYEERNRVVALLAALYPSKRWRTAIEGWSDDWHGCVYIETPEGQLSWHYHDSQESIFDHVPEGDTAWDGHTTEEKYRRVERLCDNAAFSTKPQPTDEERHRLAKRLRVRAIGYRMGPAGDH